MNRHLLGWNVGLVAWAAFFFASTNVQGGEAKEGARSLRRSGPYWSRGPKIKNGARPALGDGAFLGETVLALPGARGELAAGGGDIRIQLFGNLEPGAANKGLDAALMLKEPGKADLHFQLLRGRVLLDAAKDKATVRVRLRDNDVDLKFPGKDTLVAIEKSLYQPVGWPFPTEKAAQEPIAEIFLMVLKGTIEVQLGAETHTLKGPVLYRYVTGKGIEGPATLASLPKWINPAADASPQATKKHLGVEKLRGLLADKGVSQALSEGLASADAETQNFAVLSAASLGEIGLVVEALAKGKTSNVRVAAGAALRSYAGQAVSNDRAAHRVFLEKQFSPGQAEIVMSLLHGFAGELQGRPETLDVLIHYLGSQQPAIRELAHQQLLDQAPSALKGIAFDATASEEARQKAQTAIRLRLEAKKN